MVVVGEVICKVIFMSNPTKVMLVGRVIGRVKFFFNKKMRSSEKLLIYYVYIAFLSQNCILMLFSYRPMPVKMARAPLLVKIKVSQSALCGYSNLVPQDA